MKNLILSSSLLAILLLQTSCEKNVATADPAPSPIVKVQTQGALLKSAVWSNSATEVFSYNNDGTLKQTIGGLVNAGGHTRNFSYQNGNLTELLKDDIKKNKFTYNAAKQISSIAEIVASDEKHGSRLDFEYNTNNSLKSMKYYEFDDLKSTLKATSVYEYDVQGLLQKAVVTYPAQPNQKLEYTFADYSNEVEFTPWAVLDFWSMLQANYTFYNYPLLSRMGKLPQKFITRLVINNNVQETKSHEFKYTISNKQLQKIQYVTDAADVTFNY